MSRSRPPKCPCGRGCWVCGDKGEVRRAREAEEATLDDRDLGQLVLDTEYDEVIRMNVSPEALAAMDEDQDLADARYEAAELLLPEDES